MSDSTDAEDAAKGSEGMAQPLFPVSLALLDQLIPFHLVINADLEILHGGRSLRTLLPEIDR
ncbi:MAG: hypothetical protein ACO3P1_14075, partial [Pseudomonadales bacterium]